MQRERVQFWAHLPAGHVPRVLHLETFEGTPADIQHRARELDRTTTGTVRAWPIRIARRSRRLLTVGRGQRLSGPLARRPQPPVRLDWLPLLEALETGNRPGHLAGVPQVELARMLRPLGWTARHVRVRLRSLDRRGLVELLEDGDRWRLTPEGRRALFAVREHVEVWGA